MSRSDTIGTSWPMHSQRRAFSRQDGVSSNFTHAWMTGIETIRLSCSATVVNSCKKGPTSQLEVARAAWSDMWSPKRDKSSESFFDTPYFGLSKSSADTTDQRYSFLK